MKLRRRIVASDERAWKYTLKHGKALRNAIFEEDADTLLDELAECWKEIHENFPEDYDEFDLEDDLADIENQRDNLVNHDDYDMTYEDVQDEINYMLNNLYDFCDGYRIWIDI